METYQIIKKLNIPLLKKIDKLFSKSRKLSEENQELLESTYDIMDELSDYQVCAVGSIRERLGLTTDYEKSHIHIKYDDGLTRYRSNPNYCLKCYELANQFPKPINNISDALERYNYDCMTWKHDKTFKDSKEYFKGLLVELRLHLKNDHNVDIETVIKA